jgi:hypothetical protein
MRKALIGAIATTALTLAPASALGATLYDQTDNESIVAEEITSPGNEIADDFVVPAGVRWTITSVGSNIDGVGFSDMTVTFYADDGTGNAPTVSGSLAGGPADTLGNLASAVTLEPGHYWVGITATGLVVGWPTRTVKSNSKAVADNSGCTRWSVMQDCEVGGPGPDMSFSIGGTGVSTGQGSGGVAGGTGSSPPPPKKKKCKKAKKHSASASAKKCKKKKKRPSPAAWASGRAPWPPSQPPRRDR